MVGKGGRLVRHAPASALSRVIALRVSLDACGRDNGPLRVIPGSHASGVLPDEEVLRPLLIHSSSKSRSGEPRRVLHIEYADALDFGDGIWLAVV